MWSQLATRTCAGHLKHFPLDQSGTLAGTLAVTLESLPIRFFKSFDYCCFIWCTCTQYTRSHRPCLNCNMCEGIQTIPTSMCRPVNKLCLRSCQFACADLLLEALAWTLLVSTHPSISDILALTSSLHLQIRPRIKNHCAASFYRIVQSLIQSCMQLFLCLPSPPFPLPALKVEKASIRLNSLQSDIKLCWNYWSHVLFRPVRLGAGSV